MNRNHLKISKERHVPTVIDLFSGAGGTGAGFRDVGFKILGAVEIDENAAKTYRKNLKVEVKKTDIRDLSPAEFREQLKLEKKELNVLIGCPPCQGFSRMRNGNGADDERNDLVLSYLKFVKEFEPRYAIFENVPGMLRYEFARAFYSRLCEGLNELGYNLRGYEEDAADYGTPQHRRRIIVIAARASEELPQLIKTHGDPLSEEVQTGKLKPWLTVRDAIGNDKYPKLEAGQNGEKDGNYSNHIAPIIISQRVMEFIREVPHDGGSRRQVSREKWLPCHLNENSGHADVYGRMSWGKPANTLTCGCTNLSKGRFIHPEQDRAITYREAAALQGFDDSFVFYGKDISKQIGNAVPPTLSKALATAIKREINLSAGDESFKDKSENQQSVSKLRKTVPVYAHT
jgi:DNA (cytosine-5)-methyltransferase 1